MILLVSGATKYPRDERVGHLIVPKQWNVNLDLSPGRWAMDNGAFSGFDAGAFVRMMERFADVPGCLFVTAPDVVADAASTLALWPFWSQLIAGVGRRPAFVAQDGLTHDRVPWETLRDEKGVLFIGGSTAFKEGATVRSLVGYAAARGLWVHWGRVNGQRRLELILKAMQGCPDFSFDGSGFSRWPDTNIPMVAEWIQAIQQQPELSL
jgi:hypothetical protein